MTVFQEMVVESILLNQIKLILVSFFSEDNVLSDEIKICYIFEFQSNENRAFRFLGGHPVYFVFMFVLLLVLFYFVLN